MRVQFRGNLCVPSNYAMEVPGSHLEPCQSGTIDLLSQRETPTLPPLFWKLEVPSSSMDPTHTADFYLGSFVIHFAISEYLFPEKVPATVFLGWLPRHTEVARETNWKSMGLQDHCSREPAILAE